MNKYILITAVIIFFSSCQKEKNDNTQIKIGFYLADKNTTSKELAPYQLFIYDELKHYLYLL